MMIDYDKFKQMFLQGAAFSIGIVGIAIICIVMLSGGEDETLMKPNAEVFDTYKGSDIVRWSTSKMAEYKYFLYCEKNK